jgi:predicted metalloprotease with PDZ domain
LIEYTVRLADPRRHWIEVDCRITSSGGTEDFELPSWIPGSYLLREYAQHVVRAEGFDARGFALQVEKSTHNIWRIHAPAGEMTLRLSVYALDESVRGAWLDTQRAWFNGPCLFARPLSQPDADIRLILEPPTAELNEWQVATAMASVTTDPRGFGEYSAADYDELLDHPFVIGKLDRVDFEVAGVPHSLTVLGRQNGDLQRVAKDLTAICESQIAFFGEPAPFDRYAFLGLAVAGGYGGLEHSNSSLLMFRRSNLPRLGDADITSDYQRLLSLASHEYFHAWHVKRSRPAAFMPYRLSERNLTRLLWVFEGITSYYQDRFLLRSGRIDAKAYLRRLGELISSVMRVPGRRYQNLSDSSFDAWDKLYKPNANSPNAGVSYYSKGALAALSLDLELRAHTDSAVTLDTIIQTLWREYGAKGIGVPEGGFEALTVRMAGSEFADFFERNIRSTADPPLLQQFRELGIVLEETESKVGKWLGIASRAAAAGLECVTVFDGGPAQAAGLNPGDIIVALNHEKLTVENMDEQLQRNDVGIRIPIHYFRGDELCGSEIEVGAAPPDAYTLRIDDNAMANQLALRTAWLAG